MGPVLSQVFDSLIEEGSAKVTLDAKASAALAHVLSVAADFFALPTRRKERSSSADPNFGFRPTGVEYSQTPLRPDLIESFSIWGGPYNAADSEDDLTAYLQQALHAWRTVAEAHTAILLGGLAARFGAQPPDFADASQVQVNNCATGFPDREFIQDMHEDGHMLTILHSTDPGLEVQDSCGVSPVSFRADEVLVMTGSALTDLTAGKISPAYHRVRNLGYVNRKALMYFVNPSPRTPICPWVSDPENPQVTDLRDAIRRRPHGFGLPAIPSG